MHAPSPGANSGQGIVALSDSSRVCSETTNANCTQANTNGGDTHTESRFEIMNGDHTIINALNQGIPIPHLVDTALGCPAASGPYHLSTREISEPFPTSAGSSTVSFATRGNTIRNKRVLPGASGCTYRAKLVSDSVMSTFSAGPSNSDHSIRGNATQMKRALSEASSRIAAVGAQKRPKGDLDPVGIP